MKISAVIFDLNGTILSDEGVYGRAFTKVLESMGADVENDYPHVAGIGVKENWPLLIEKFKIETEKTHDELAYETQKEYEQLIKEIGVKKGFEKFATALRKSNILMGLATSNTWDVADMVLKRFDLHKYFDSITTCEEVNLNKPNPQIYLTTALKMGVNPVECVVFEDSSAGIVAAHLAGMRTVGVVRDDEHKKKLKDASWHVRDFTDLNYKKLADKLKDKIDI